MRPPDHQGPAGRAWQLPDPGTSPISYLIEAPGQSPFWSQYLLALIDLADLPGVEPAYREFPDARWEFTAVALDPEYPQDPDSFQLHPLVPANAVVQVPDHPAELVTSCTTALMQAVLAGAIAIEPPFTSIAHTARWREIIEATLEHPHHHGEQP